MLKMHADSDDLREVSGKVLDLIEEGRYIRRADPKIIAEEIRRLSTTIKGRLAAEDRLKNAGEYAVPLMLGAIADPCWGRLPTRNAKMRWLISPKRFRKSGVRRFVRWWRHCRCRILPSKQRPFALLGRSGIMSRCRT
ncbi:MAG: hypothetical protein ACYSO3_09285 [Planctomycetota bacterium]